MTMGFISLQGEQLSLRTVTKPRHPGEDGGAGKPHALLEGVKIGAGTKKISVGVPKTRATSGPAAALGNLPGGIKANVVGETCTFFILIIALFMTPELQGQETVCLSISS